MRSKELFSLSASPHPCLSVLPGAPGGTVISPWEGWRALFSLEVDVYRGRRCSAWEAVMTRFHCQEGAWRWGSWCFPWKQNWQPVQVRIQQITSFLYPASHPQRSNFCLRKSSVCSRQLMLHLRFQFRIMQQPERVLERLHHVYWHRVLVVQVEDSFRGHLRVKSGLPFTWSEEKSWGILKGNFAAWFGWFTFKIHSIHEHQHHVMGNSLQKVWNVTIGGVLHPLVDLLHRNQRDRPGLVPD